MNNLENSDFTLNSSSAKCNILVSQPEPAHSSSPYLKLAEAYNLDLNFRRFVKIVPTPLSEFRKHKLEIPKHTAIIFTSRGTIDHFFNLCREIKLEVSPDTKYFCVSEQISNYLQKYIQLKKRKVFYGGRTISDLFIHFKKNPNEKFLFACSEFRNQELTQYFSRIKKPLYELIVCNTIPDNLSDLNLDKYKIITFFSPTDVMAFVSNFKDFDQKDRVIAAFGKNTIAELQKSGITPNIEAPTHEAPSMAKALELYITKSKN